MPHGLYIGEMLCTCDGVGSVSYSIDRRIPTGAMKALPKIGFNSNGFREGDKCHILDYDTYLCPSLLKLLAS